MATQKIKWYKKDGTLLHPVTEWSAIENAPNSLKNPSSLSITVNGTTTTYDGSSAKSVSITTGSGNALDFFRVGYVYISYTSTSPASLFGGSWTAITGRFPYFNAGTGTGGSNNHTLTKDEMPSHTHDIGIRIRKTRRSSSNDYGATGNHFVTNESSSSDMTTSPVDWSTMTTAGKGTSFSIMPAYQTLYAWRRTA